MADWDKKIDWDSEKASSLLAETRVKKMLELVGTGKKVLDVGCYTGDEALVLKEAGNEVIGIDCVEDFLRLTRDKGIPAYRSNLEESIPFDYARFDQIFAGEVIEHIVHTEVFLKECHRVLKPGGELILSTPNINYWGYRLKMLLGGTLPFSIESGETTEMNPNHVRYFTVASLTYLLKKYGFEVEVMRGSTIYHGALELSAIADAMPTLAYHLIVKAKRV